MWNISKSLSWLSIVLRFHLILTAESKKCSSSCLPNRIKQARVIFPLIVSIALFRNLALFQLSISSEYLGFLFTNSILAFFIASSSKSFIVASSIITLVQSSLLKFSFKIVENNEIAFDHALVILLGLERLKNKIQ